jgi:hypothetical protein
MRGFFMENIMGKERVLTYPDLLDEIQRYKGQGILGLSDTDYAINEVITWSNKPCTGEQIPFWELREQIRKKYNIYEPINFITIDSDLIFRGLPPNLYAHQAKDLTQPAMIAFTKDAVGGEKDVQMISRIGKFLKKYAPDLTEQQINDTANEYTQLRETRANSHTTGLFFLTNTKEIINAYKQCTTSSCMSYNESKWQLTIEKDDNKNINPAIIDDLLHARDGRYIHPSALYAHMPNIALAVYKVRNRIVSRVIVNRETKKYTKVYGNFHINALLADENYKKGQLYPTTLPIIKVKSPNVSGLTFLAPYLDGDTPAVIPKASVYYDKSHAEIHAGPHGLALRAYSTGALPYRTTLVCHDCNILTASTAELQNHTPRNNDREYIKTCKPCSIVRRVKTLETVRFAFGIEEDCLYIIEDTLDNFIPFTGKLPHSLFDLSALRNSLYRSNTNINVLRQLEREGKHEKLVETHTEFAQTHIHKNALDKLDTDAVSGVQEFISLMKGITLPDETIGLTIQSRMEILSPQSTTPNLILSDDMFNQGLYKQLLKEKDCENLTQLPDNAIRLTEKNMELITFARRQDCIEAITDIYNNKILMPRNLCVFAVKTGKWFATNNTKTEFYRDLITSEELRKALDKYGVQIMHAGEVVDNYFPHFLSRALRTDQLIAQVDMLTSFQTGWSRWHEEIHSSNRLKGLIPALKRQQAALAPPPI